MEARGAITFREMSEMKPFHAHTLDIGRQAIRVGWQILKQLSGKNYYLAKVYGIMNLHLSNGRDRNSLIVFQMGKVGSTTIMRSLKALELDLCIYHVHTLSQDTMRLHEKIYKKNFSNRRRIDSQLLASYYLHKQLDKRGEDKKWKIVTLVRDPIARNLSSFFEVLDLEFSDYGYQHKIDSMKPEMFVEELIELFFEKFRHDTPLVWFDRELKGTFDIDVFAADFPKSKGYQIYEGERADVLLLRLEDINRCASVAFAEFLNLDNFTLIKANIGSDKYYSATYRRILDSIALPESYTDKMYKSKYAQHFYSEEEIEAFRAKWCRLDRA